MSPQKELRALMTSLGALGFALTEATPWGSTWLHMREDVLCHPGVPQGAFHMLSFVAGKLLAARPMQHLTTSMTDLLTGWVTSDGFVRSSG